MATGGLSYHQIADPFVGTVYCWDWTCSSMFGPFLLYVLTNFIVTEMNEKEKLKNINRSKGIALIGNI
jgi:hypothetical protein